MPLFTVNIEHLHVHAVDAETRELLSQILSQQEALMASFADIKDFIPALNDATNALATRVQSILDRLPPEADVQGVFNDLNALKSQLQGIAADPNNPLPPVV